MNKKTEQIPDELDYATSLEANTAIMRAMNDIIFMQNMERLMPLVVKELVKAGVDFSKAKAPGASSGDSKDSERANVSS